MENKDRDLQTTDDLSTDALPIPPRSLQNDANPQASFVETSNDDESHGESQPKRYDNGNEDTQPSNVLDENVTQTKEKYPASTDRQHEHEKEHERMETSKYFPELPENWEFNAFLNRLSKNLNSTDLKEMKSLFIDEIGKGLLEKIESPVELFRVLRERRFLTKENLYPLQAILKQLGRMDLLKEAVEYGQSMEDTVYVVPASDKPENGYSHVKFHVVGMKLKDVPRDYLSDLRTKVSKYLVVPRQFILVDGLEPSSSILITLMIPEMYALLLKEMLETGKDILHLAEIGIDTVDVDGTIYSVQGGSHAVDVQILEDKEIICDVRQLRKTKAQLEVVEIRNLQLHRDIEILKTKLNNTNGMQAQVESLADHFKRILKPSFASNEECSRFNEETKEAVDVFIESWIKATNVGYDRDLLQDLIFSNARVIAGAFKSQDVMESLSPLLAELVKSLGYMLKITEATGGLQQWLSIFAKQTETEACGKKVVENVTLPSWLDDILTILSTDLRDEDKENLKSRYTWDSQTSLTCRIEKNPGEFLVCLCAKEMLELRKRGVLSCSGETFVSYLLNNIDRNDLCAKFTELLHREEEKIQSKDKKENLDAIYATRPIEKEQSEEIPELD